MTKARAALLFLAVGALLLVGPALAQSPATQTQANQPPPVTAGPAQPPGAQPAPATNAPAQAGANSWQPLDSRFVYAVVIVAFAGIFIAFAAVCRILRDHPKWSLADALSEEADVPVTDAAGQPVIGANGAAVTKPQLAASTSRLIAFVGTIGILGLFLGFGAIIMCQYGKSGSITNADAIGKYLLGGLTLFAPYVVNKFSSVFAPK